MGTESAPASLPPRRGEENVAQGVSPGSAAPSIPQAPEGRQNPAAIGSAEASPPAQIFKINAAKQEDAHTAKIPRGLLESRLEAALAELSAPAAPPSATVRQGHLALLKRWYYRPEARRAGEIFFPDAEGRWPIKAILRGIGRVAAKQIPEQDRA